MGLSRIKLEKKIIKSLTEKVEKLGFQLIKEKYQGNRHIFKYVWRQDKILYELVICIFKSHFLKLDAHFHIYHDKINEFIKSVDIDFVKAELYSTIDIIFNSFEQQIYIDERKNYSTFNQKDIDHVVELSYQRFFLDYVMNDIVPKTNTIQKLNELINDEKHLNREDVDMYPLIGWVFPVQSQVINGVILALLCKKSNYKEIIKRYIKYIDFDFEKDEDETIELVYKIIEKYEPELMKLSIRSRN
jgi:hypothetical protein